jgi:Uma2 family endonuclease
MAETTQTASKPFTWEDYVNLPDDGKRYQVIEGELHVAAAPLFRHQDIVGRLYRFLLDFVEDHDLGIVGVSDIDVVLSDRNIVQPDVLFIRKDRMGIIRGQVHGAPDLVVEVLSPSNQQLDLKDKMALYARFGVPHYWILNPEERVLIAFRLTDGKYERAALCQGDDTFQPELFEGLTIELSEVWSDL